MTLSVVRVVDRAQSADAQRRARERS